MQSDSWDFDRLTSEEQSIIVSLIAADTLAKTNAGCRKVCVTDSFYARYGKRLLDICISLPAVILTLPINLIIGIITLFDVGLPLFYAQDRIGRNGRLFKLVKFRNMTNECDEHGVILPADERITKWGNFARRTSLDELLNFVSVLKGDMALIGPRPLPKVYMGRFNDTHEARHSVRPGLECPLHDDAMQYMTWQNRLDNDAWYVENISLSTDFKLLLRLFKMAFGGDDKAARGQGGSEGTFMGYDFDGRVMDSKHIPDEYYERMRSIVSERDQA